MEANQVILTPVPIGQILSQVESIITRIFDQHQQSEFQAKLLSPSETCKLFNPAISKVTLHQWTKDGLIPSYRMGGRVYYKTAEVIQAVKTIKKFDRDKIPVK